MSEQTAAPLKLTINGIEIESGPGRMLIDVAEEHGVFVPRFCYHPGLESVAACRMCLVQIEGSKRPLEPACATVITDGMVVHTDAEPAVEAQRSVLELLLINHPLDCPVCDRGGECPLQDQTLGFGPGSTRYVEEKRHFTKPLPISDLVMLDRERCVLCWRCVRFADEVAGDPFIDLIDRGSHSQINVAGSKTFDSHFSGNTIQICPVGALTSVSHRFQTRPWDLTSAPTTCSFCAVGCPISLEHRSGEVMRAQALPNENVNSFWNCDKGRFGHRYVSNPERLHTPLLKRGGEFVESSWDEALSEVAERLRSTIATAGPGAVGFIGGSHATNEDVFAASKLFREVIGTGNLDFRTFDSAFDYPKSAVNGVVGSSATLNDLDTAQTIVWMGPDPKEELPVLFLRIRKAVKDGAKLIVIGPRRISLSALGRHITVVKDRTETLDALFEDPSFAEAVGAERVVVCVGQQFVGRSMGPELAAIRRSITDNERAKLLLCVPNANSQGALDMGLIPGSAAGHRRALPGLGTAAMLRAAAEGNLGFLWLMGADVLTDFPDSQLARRALKSGAFIVVSELFPTDTARSAAVVLPCGSVAEKEGSYTNLERRIQKVNPAVGPPGVARSDWQIFQDVAGRLGSAWGWTGSSDVAASIASEVPTHAAFTWHALSQAPDAQPSAGSAPASPPVSPAAWPLSWELRAIDATRRGGLVWEGHGEADAAGSPSDERDDAFSTYEFPLELLVSRALYDSGQMVTRSPEMRNLIEDPFVELHPREAHVRGISEGDEVTVESRKDSVQLRVAISENTPEGAAWMLFDQKDVQANVLMDSGKTSTYVQVKR